MAVIDYSQPAISPPSALDVAESPDAPTAPTAAQYVTPPGALQGEALSPELGAFASQTLAEPSRFDMPLVQQGIDLTNQSLARQGELASAGMDEFYTSRGLTGSSVETEGQRQMRTDLEQQRQQRLFDLNMAQAQTLAGDRTAAANIGTQIGDFQRALGLDRTNEGRYGAEFARLTGQDQFANQMAAAQYGLNANASEFGQNLSAQDFAQRQAEFTALFGQAGSQLSIEQQKVDLEAQRLQQQALTEGRTLDLTEAQQQASVNLEVQRLQQQAQLEGRSLDITEARNQAEQNIQQQSLAQSQAQFQATLGEQQAARTQQYGISQQQLDLQAQELQQQAQLEGRSMDITEARNQAESDIRVQQMQQEAQLAGQDFDLRAAQQQINQEQFDADIGLRTEQLQQQAQAEGRSLTLEEARLEAERDWEVNRLGEATAARLQDADLSGRDLDLRAQQLEHQYAMLSSEESRDLAEIDLRREQYLGQQGIDTQALQLQAEEIAARERMQGRDITSQEAMNQAEIEARATLQANDLVAAAEARGETLTHDEAMQEARIGAEAAMQEDRLRAETDMFDAEMVQRRTEFAGQMNISTQELGLQREQMTREYADRQADRLHQMGLQDDSQAFAATQAKLDRELERAALALQRDGLDAETAWRNADRDLQAELERRSLQFQEDGLSAEVSWRQAADQLERDMREQDRYEQRQDRELQRGVANQQAALSEWDIFLRALTAMTAAGGDAGDLPGMPNVGNI